MECVAFCGTLIYCSRHLLFAVFTSNNFETATGRTVSIAPLSDLHPYYFGQECFREPANFRMLGDSRSQRAALTADDKLFVLLLNTCSSAYGFQGNECRTDTTLHVPVLSACRLSTS